MSDSVQPHRRQPTRLPHPWDSPGKNTGVGCHFLLQCRKVKSESEVASRVRLLATPWTPAYQAPLSMGFSRQEYWSGVPLPSPISDLKCILNVFSQKILSLFSSQAHKRNSQTFCLLILNIQSHHLYYQSEMMSSPYLTTKQMSSLKEPSKVCYVDSLQPHTISLLLLSIKGLPGSQCLPSSQKPIYLIDLLLIFQYGWPQRLSLYFLLVINNYTCSRHCYLEKKKRNTALQLPFSASSLTITVSLFTTKLLKNKFSVFSV